jgi:hypothetical protein
MLLSALITKAHFKLNGQSEAQALAKVRQWPQDPRRAAARTAYLDIVSRNNGSWRGQFLGDDQRAPPVERNPGGGPYGRRRRHDQQSGHL